MRSIRQVVRINSTQWQWKAGVPRSNAFVEWKTEVVEQIDNEVIVWRTMTGSDINHEGIVEFHALPDGMSTEIDCKIVYLPPGGELGDVVTKIMGKLNNVMLKKEMQRFKYFMEPRPSSPALEDVSTEQIANKLLQSGANKPTRPGLR